MFEIKYIILALSFILSCFVAGSAGFGSVVVAAPFTVAILGAKMAVPFGLFMALPLQLIIIILNFKKISWKYCLRVLAFCFPCLLIGHHLFKIISPNIAQLAIGIVIVLIALLKINEFILQPLVFKKDVDMDKPKTTFSKIFDYSCLIVGAIVHGAFNIGGPLISVYTLATVKEKLTYRNTMLAIFVSMDIINAINHLNAGALTFPVFKLLLLCWPFAVIGFLIGTKFLKKINVLTFQRFVSIVLLLNGLFMGGNALMALL